jgi:RNA polymerase sigma-70 factor (ECF subfamily)
VARARRGDLEAWSRLYQETFDVVFRHVCCLTGDSIAAEDLVQDVYARAMLNVQHYDQRASFVAWVRGIALNVVRMHWRRARTTDRVHGQLQRMAHISERRGGTAPDLRHLRDQKLQALYHVLAVLPEGLREAFVLREIEGLSTHDAGAQLGISPGNVAVRASRARTRIRKELARLGWLTGGWS